MCPSRPEGWIVQPDNILQPISVELYNQLRFGLHLTSAHGTNLASTTSNSSTPLWSNCCPLFISFYFVALFLSFWDDPLLCSSFISFINGWHNWHSLKALFLQPQHAFHFILNQCLNYSEKLNQSFMYLRLPACMLILSIPHHHHCHCNNLSLT